MGIFFDGAYEVLKVMQKPMHYVELTQLAIDRGLIESDGKTPDQTMNKELHKAAKESFYESKIIFLGDGIFALSDNHFNQEISYRINLFNGLPDKTISNSEVEELGLYSGQAGIFRNLSELKNRGIQENITMSLLHTESQYLDLLDEENGKLTYRYPNTKRKGHDNNEIQSLKNCLKYNIPIFLLVQKQKKQKRIYLAYVENFNDDEELFKISFINEKYSSKISNIELEEDIPDEVSPVQKKLMKVIVRTNQREFRKKIELFYGNKCAVCSMKKILEAAHIKPKSDEGIDHHTNGLFLCRNHHYAFDNYLFGINPETLIIENDDKELKIEEIKLNTKNKKTPSKIFLEWRWERYISKNFDAF